MIVDFSYSQFIIHKEYNITEPSPSSASAATMFKHILTKLEEYQSVYYYKSLNEFLQIDCEELYIDQVTVLLIIFDFIVYLH